MKTISITTTYNVKGFINDNYIMTQCGLVINIKLGKVISPALRGSKVMYWIDGSWQSNFTLNTNKVECPF